MSSVTESRKALREFINLLEEVDERWAGPEWNLTSDQDVVMAHRNLMHLIEGGVTGMFEFTPSHPDFRRIVSPHHKFTGDNGDAIYFDAPVSPDYAYVVRGNMNGAVYFSLTVEVGTEMGTMASNTDGVLNDTMMDIDADGNFEVFIGGEPRERNWLELKPGASRITTRHYFENKRTAGDDPRCTPVMEIKNLDESLPPPPPPSDDSVALGIRRVAEFVRSRTLGMPPMAQQEAPPPFFAMTPNEFPKPVVPGDFGLAAYDAHYSMAPFFINEGEALVVTGRWPEQCRCANICLWNRFQQTLDYANRTVTLNRAQTQLEPDGSFRIVIAHEDPGQPNWIDTEGSAFGLVFWRFFLVEGDVETPQAEVVKLADLQSA